MDVTGQNRLARFLAINRTVGIVLLTVLLFGLGEQLWHPFLPLFLKSQAKAYTEEVATTGGLSAVALWTIGTYACLLNLFQGFCYIGGGQLTAYLGGERFRNDSLAGFHGCPPWACSDASISKS